MKIENREKENVKKFEVRRSLSFSSEDLYILESITRWNTSISLRESWDFEIQ